NSHELLIRVLSGCATKTTDVDLRGVEMSMLAFGTGSRGCSPPTACVRAVEEALSLGWRTIDAAWEYGTQRLVAQGIAAAGVSREELFIITKIPGPVGANASRYVEDDLAQLQMPYVDLLLMHYPCGEAWPQPRDGCNATEDAQDAARRLATWRAMERLHAAGKVKALGVSNFRQEHLRQLLAEARVPPSVNQVQWHLGYHDDALHRFCAMNGIILQAYSPLGGGGTSTGRDGGIALDDPLVVAVARRHSVSDAQVALRWSIDQGVAVVTSSVRADYLAEDLAVLRFQLAPEEVVALSRLHSAVPAVRIVDDWPDVMMPSVALACGDRNATSVPLGLEGDRTLARSATLQGSRRQLSGDGALATTTVVESSRSAVLAWGKAGGRHLDLPANDKEELIDALAGLGDLLAAGVASRKEMFVTARTHGGPIGYEATVQWVTNLMLSSNSSLGGWIDLLLISAPCLHGKDACRADSASDRTAVLDTWKAFVKLRKLGKVRAIGVANFAVAHMAWIIGEADGDGRLEHGLSDDPPANTSAICINQVEFHLGYHDDALQIYCDRHQVTLQAGAGPFAHAAPPPSNPSLVAVAAAHNVTTQQVALRWALQLNVPVVANPAKDQDDLMFLEPLFSFTLSAAEMETLSGLALPSLKANYS
ncbi:hypothetical protein CYMTET_46456, partial [Cymbomonas tetramitiformis]